MHLYNTVEYRETLDGQGACWGVNDGKSFIPFGPKHCAEDANTNRINRYNDYYIKYPIEKTVLLDPTELTNV